MKHFYLSLTEACNLSCAWCFWKARPDRSRDAFDLEAILESIADQIGEATTCGLVFYGGEPTLRMECMRAVMDAVGERFAPLEWRFAVQTNGSHLERLLPLASRLHYLSVSFNSFTLEAMRWSALEQLGNQLPIIARLTYVGRPLRDFVELALPFVSHVYWQLLNAAERPFTLEDYSRELDALLALAAAHPDTAFIPLDHAWSFLHSSTCAELPRWFPCGIGGDLVYLDPGGKIFACDELCFEQLEVDLAATRREIEAICSTCEIRPVCLGRCPATFIKYGRQAYLEYCRFNHLLVEKVRASRHAGRPLDAIGLQTEVMH